MKRRFESSNGCQLADHGSLRGGSVEVNQLTGCRSLGGMCAPNLLCVTAMAKIIGEAARYTTAQSVQLFQKMLLTSMIVIFGVGTFEGANLASLFWRWGNAPLWIVLPMTAGLIATWWVCRYQRCKIEEYEQRRMNFRKGTRGEQTVVEVLEALSDEFYVINDVKIAGNLDHVVVGPTGVFAIETKNWRGAVCADGKGELLCNGKPTTKPEVKGLVRRLMKTREKLTALTECDVFIKGVMVFPRARVDARFGTTSCALRDRRTALRVHRGQTIREAAHKGSSRPIGSRVYRHCQHGTGVHAGGVCSAADERGFDDSRFVYRRPNQQRRLASGQAAIAGG